MLLYAILEIVFQVHKGCKTSLLLDLLTYTNVTSPAPLSTAIYISCPTGDQLSS